MPDPWYPQASRLSGANAGYRAGRITNLTTAIAHYTVGRNSTGTCGRDFQILAARDGTIFQGAEVDAVNWGAGDPWNHNSVHVEVEYLPGADDTIFTDAARTSVAAFLHWLEAEWGVPLEYYDGDRRTSWKGVISHRSLIQTGDWHFDYWPQEDWDAMVAPTPAPPSEEDRMQPELMADEAGVVYVYDANAHTKTRVDGPATLNAITSVWALHGVNTKIADSGAARDILKGAVEIT